MKKLKKILIISLCALALLSAGSIIGINILSDGGKRPLWYLNDFTVTKVSEFTNPPDTFSGDDKAEVIKNLSKLTCAGKASTKDFVKADGENGYLVYTVYKVDLIWGGSVYCGIHYHLLEVGSDLYFFPETPENRECGERLYEITESYREKRLLKAQAAE